MRKILLIVLAAAMLLGTGCEYKKGKNETTVSTETEKENSATDVGELAIYSYKPDTLCPVLSNNEANIQMLNLVYDGLVSICDDMKAEAALAESWAVSEDGLEWSFKLRGGVLWHSGDLFCADDVVYTVNTIKAHPESVYAYNVSKISSVRASGDTVFLKLSQPNPSFPNLMYFPIIRNGSVGGDITAFVPVGTGIYRFEDRNEGNIYYLTAFEGAWRGSAETDCIKIRMLPDRDTALYAFSAGTIDMTATSDMNWGKYVDAASVVTERIKTPIYTFIGVNHDNAILKETAVRTAISEIVDRKEIKSIALMDYAAEASAPIRGDWAVGEGQTGDFKKKTSSAKRILEEAGWKNDGSGYKRKEGRREQKLSFDILINEDNPLRVNIAEMIEIDLEDFGISANIVKVPYDEYISRIEGGKFDLFLGSTVIPADMSLDYIVGEGNLFGFEDAEMTAVIENMRTAQNDELKSAYAEIINLFEQLNPVIGLFFEDNVMIKGKTLKGESSPSYYSLYRGAEKLSK